MKKMFIVMILALCAPWSRVMADGITPIQASVWSPIQVFPRDWDVVGFRFGGFYSRNRHVYGLDLGLVNRADASSGGIQLGLMNTASKSGGRFLDSFGSDSYARLGERPARYTGIQLGFMNHADEMWGLQYGLFNDARTIKGLQLAPGCNICYGVSDVHSGVQLALVGNNAFGDFNGAQIGAGNITFEEMHGLQFGILNFADTMNLADKEMHGLQLGILNGAGRMRGLQFGVFNVAQKLYGIQIGVLNIIIESPIPVLPVINAQF